MAKQVTVLVGTGSIGQAIIRMVNAAGVSPSQAPVAEILRVDLYGTSVLMEEFGKVIAEGGSGVIISSQSGHRLARVFRGRQRHDDEFPEPPVLFNEFYPLSIWTTNKR